MINDVCHEHRLGERRCACCLPFLLQKLVLNFDFLELLEMIGCPGCCWSGLDPSWFWGRDPGRTVSEVCPHPECRGPPDSLLCLQVEVLPSLEALSQHVEPGQLPAALGGPFPYCHSEWVQFFQVSAITASSLPLTPPSLSCPLNPSPLVWFRNRHRPCGAAQPGLQSQHCCVTSAESLTFSGPWFPHSTEGDPLTEGFL